MLTAVLLLNFLSSGDIVADLPQLNIKSSAITISGISSGADFASQFHVAFSSVISGVGIFAGQPFGCAVTRFPDDVLVNSSCAGKASCSTPVCDGCPAGTSLLYDHCKNHPEWVDPEVLQALAQKASDAQLIDNVTNMRTHPVYLYRGTKDGCYLSGSEARVIEFYRGFVGDGGRSDGGLIAFENTIPSMHAQPTIHAGSPCGGPYDGPYSYLASCNYDGAGAVLNHVYPNLDQKAVSKANLSHLVTFNQTNFFPTDGRDPGLAESAYAFIPQDCLNGEECKLHLWLHGCGGPQKFYNASVHYAGFNEWAQTNRIVVVYPAMRSWGATGQEKGGCWDGYAQTGADYLYKSGLQMGTVFRMIQHVAGLP